jgi:CubicO group peptidase (beta-lactamase class C family)
MWRSLLVALFGTWTVAAQTPVESARAAIRKMFADDQPGAAVAVVRAGEPLILEGFGLADVAEKTPITPDTAFDLASVSKQFTATAVLHLMERGKLSLDDPVRRWVPDFDGPETVTLRHLLNHTSGLVDYLAVYRGSDDDFAKLQNRDVARIVAGRKPKFEPGSRFEYSNTNYALLPVVVEAASGKTFGKYLEDFICHPIGMNRTRVMDHLPCRVEGRATGYGKRFGLVGKLVPRRKDGPICGDGNVFSTARDLVAWDSAQREGRLLRHDTWQLAWTPPTLAGGQKSDYGFGWVLEREQEQAGVWHNGRWAGTRTIMYRRTRDQLTVIILSNNEVADVDGLCRSILKAFP